MLEEACIIHPVELPCDDRVIRRAEFLVTLATSSAAFSPRLANFYMYGIFVLGFTEFLRKKATEVGDTENLCKFEFRCFELLSLFVFAFFGIDKLANSL